VIAHHIVFLRRNGGYFLRPTGAVSKLSRSPDAGRTAGPLGCIWRRPTVQPVLAERAEDSAGKQARKDYSLRTRGLTGCHALAGYLRADSTILQGPIALPPMRQFSTRTMLLAFTLGLWPRASPPAGTFIRRRNRYPPAKPVGPDERARRRRQCESVFW
jgi:hypothetical protein